MKRFYKWTSGSAELLLGIPVLGGAFILSTGWTALGVMLLVHILGLLISIKRDASRIGHTMGIVASILGVIPVLGMILHLVVGLMLIYEAIKEEQESDIIQVNGDTVVVEDVEVDVMQNPTSEAKVEKEVVLEKVHTVEEKKN